MSKNRSRSSNRNRRRSGSASSANPVAHTPSLLAPSDFTPLQSAIEMIFQLEEERAGLIREELATMPDGSLYLKFVADKPYFDRKIDGSRVAITHDIDLIYKLARKRYLQLKLQEHNEQCYVNDVRRTVRMRPLAQRIRKLLDRYHHAELDLMRITLSPEQYHWVHSDYFKNDMDIEKKHRTYSGVIMRSKSERDIGNELEIEGVPYRYDAGMVLDVTWMDDVIGDIYPTKYYYPDFMILTVTGDIIIWEHLGRLDMKDYRLRNAEKFAAMRQGGYVPEEFCILTVEKDLEDGNFIRQLIARRVLPYM